MSRTAENWLYGVRLNPMPAQNARPQNIDLTTTTTGYRIVKRGGWKWRAAAGRNFSMPCRAVVDRIPLLRQRPIGVRQRRVRVGPDRSADIFNCVERCARHPAGDVA